MVERLCLEHNKITLWADSWHNNLVGLPASFFSLCMKFSPASLSRMMKIKFPFLPNINRSRYVAWPVKQHLRYFASTPKIRVDSSADEIQKLKILYETEAEKPDRMIIGFTCKVCNTRDYKSMSKKSYNQGVVIIKCDSCKNLHLIADHLGWFDSMKNIGTIEDILKEKGESVQKLEYLPEDVFRK